MPRVTERYQFTKKVLVFNQSGFRYRTISKRFQLHPSRLKQITGKRGTFNMTYTLPWSNKKKKNKSDKG